LDRQGREVNDAGRPAGAGRVFSTATVEDTSMVLRDDDELDASPTPALSTHEVIVDQYSSGSPSNMHTNGIAATFTQSMAVNAGQQVPPSHTVQLRNLVQDTAGNDKAVFGGCR
jgi:hypothetical protein